MTEIARYSLHYITDIYHYKHLSRHLAVGLLISKLLAGFNGFNEINAFFEVLILIDSITKATQAKPVRNSPKPLLYYLLHPLLMLI